jgi:hypothetical protein
MNQVQTLTNREISVSRILMLRSLDPNCSHYLSFRYTNGLTTLVCLREKTDAWITGAQRRAYNKGILC